MKKIALEDAEQKTKSFFGYPLFIGLVTIVFAMVINQNSSYNGMIISYAFLILFFLGVMFASERKIKFNKQKIMVFVCSLVIGFLVPIIFMKSEGFNTFRN